MSGLSYAVRDSATMFRRDLKHAQRFPMLTVSGLLLPILLLLLFEGVFGHALRTGLGATAGSASYIDFLTPGILVMTAGFAAETTAVSVCNDMAEGIIARFRTMAISRASVLTGQVIGAAFRTLISATLVIGVAMLIGFRSSASPVAWIAATGVFIMLTVALLWLTVAFGLLAKTPAGANSLALIPAFLPFISSAFIPSGSIADGGTRWFAANEPFTPIINTLRGLLTGTPIGHAAFWAVGWCIVLTAAGYLWARSLYGRTRPS
ncbi:MAG TPA: ABC transporter permease [Streptosporangiaceae bacterium]